MYERLTNCPLCKSVHFLNHLVVKDHAHTQESFTICHCRNCELWFTNPRPTLEAIGHYYDHQNYISHKNKSSNLINFIYKAVRKITIQKKLNWIRERHKSPGRLLDFGCGTGHFLYGAKSKGWLVSGVEPNENARNYAISKHKLNIYDNLAELKKENKYDVITLFHVLEHVHDIKGTIKSLLELLKKRGTIYIAVPNRESTDSQYYKENWAALDVPRHLYHFNKKSMEVLAEKNSLKIIDQKPMIFDTYYVSLLSDKYLQQKVSLLTSIIKGYRFNKMATEKNNYSSILFILKKK
jgi:2-polyprenyl-3-methyl-5-hydroxy-6-metoxy-1,4-benzoquinol methylase